MANLAIELDAYVLPKEHGVYKLFPGRRYRLNREIVDQNAAFLDIRGLEDLDEDPSKWEDAELRQLIAQDRLLQELKPKVKKRATAEDTRRLGFLKGLLLTAQEGDLVVVPLGKGLDAEVAIGEFSTPPGVIELIDVQDGEESYAT